LSGFESRLRESYGKRDEMTRSFRQDWSFPVRTDFLLECVLHQLSEFGAEENKVKAEIEKRKKENAKKDRQLSKIIAEHPDVVRLAKKETGFPERYVNQRNRAQELAQWAWALLWDLERDPHRMVKMSINDLLFFRPWELPVEDD
jgi:hypothetical protein